MRIFLGLTLAVSALASTPALAAPCARALAAPTAAERGGFGLVMTTLDRTGTATYSEGNAIYTPSLNRRGRPPTQPRWSTDPGRHADHHVDIGRTLRGLDPPRRFAVGSMSINIVGLNSPSVTIRNLNTGAIHNFITTCSTGDVIHGTSPVLDILIYLKRPLVANPL